MEPIISGFFGVDVLNPSNPPFLKEILQQSLLLRGLPEFHSAGVPGYSYFLLGSVYKDIYHVILKIDPEFHFQVTQRKIAFFEMFTCGCPETSKNVSD